MKFETVIYNVENHTARITLNRPQARNAFIQKMRFELLEAFQAANASDNVRVILFGGEGKGFCAGADLAEKLPGNEEDGFITEQIRNEYEPIFSQITDSSKPVIGVINGAAAGIGGALAMACDMLVMEEKAFLYSAFGAIGLIPDGGMHYFLRNALGPKKAFEMIALSQRLTAAQCETLGMANRVVSANELWSTADNLATELAQKAPLALKYNKMLLAEAAENDLKTIIDREAVIQNIMVHSEDSKEGITAFLEKRQPKFKGC